MREFEVRSVEMGNAFVEVVRIETGTIKETVRVYGNWLIEAKMNRLGGIVERMFAKHLPNNV